MSSSGSDAVREQITSDARNKDGSPHETAPSDVGPRDAVDPQELAVGPADGDQGPREEQKRDGGM